MLLHAYDVFKDDSVYDTQRGYGTVAGVGNTTIAVVFSGDIQIIYDSLGRANRSGSTTLYWHNPISMIPPKSADEWLRRKSMVAALNTYFSKD